MNLEANVQIGDFRIEKRLGAGGMGVVFLARQLSLNRLVALKVLGSALTDQSDIARFQREAQAIAKLNHAGIAGVYFVGQDREVCHIAMEYIDGMSLREVMKTLQSSADRNESIDNILQATSLSETPPELRYDDPTLTLVPESPSNDRPVTPDALAQAVRRLITSSGYVRRCCEIVRDVALALAHAHERRVIHRDIKPENVLLDRQGKPHLIDFGLARFFEDVTLTNTGALVGTPMYMSPEQVTARIELDHRTDIYSLGLVLYEMLILSRPFTSPTREGILRRIVTKSMPPISHLNPAVSRDLESVIHKAMSKDPDERYPSSSEFASDLNNFLSDKPVSAPRYYYRLDEREILAERPWQLVAAVVLLLAFTIIELLFMNTISIGLIYESLRFVIGSQIRDELEYRIIFSVTVILSMYVLLITYSLMRARPWSFWAALVLSVGLTVAMIDLLGLAVAGNRALPVQIQFYLLYLLILVSVIPLLLSAKSRRWFRFAARVRAEHNQEGRSAHPG